MSRYHTNQQSSLPCKSLVSFQKNMLPSVYPFDTQLNAIEGSRKSVSTNTLLRKAHFEDKSAFSSHAEYMRQIASLQVYGAILLTAWRNRRKNKNHLLNVIDNMKKSNLKAQNQIHVYTTLVRVEQKRNDDLSCKLKESLLRVNESKSSCENLTTSLISLKTDKELLEQELQNKLKDLEALNMVYNQTKSDLFRSMFDHRSLQTHLCREQRKVQLLESSKSKLISELCQLGVDFQNEEEKFIRKMEIKNKELRRAFLRIEELEFDLNTIRNSLNIKISNENMLLKDQIKKLQYEVHELQNIIDDTFGKRVHYHWNKFLYCTNCWFEMMQCVIAYILPATPPPLKFSEFNNVLLGFLPKY